MINRQFFSKMMQQGVWASIMLVCFAGSAQAQFGFGGFGTRLGVVGGVSIDAEGALRNASATEREGWLRDLRNSVTAPSGELASTTELRMISLSQLQAEIQKSIDEDKTLPEEVLYLAGLQRVEYVFVYPERQDIVLAGPAEGWVVREDATVVGKTSGKPVLQLEDLLTALRTAQAARQQPISVSIDPTPEGELRLNRLLSTVRSNGLGGNPQSMEAAMRDAFGPQQVKLTTIATDSRMATTLVAADYRMKRLAMGLEESPVEGLPSYMELIRNGGASQGTQPRWWISCKYDAILHSDDMLAWKLTGSGIQAMTEDEFVDQQGARAGTGKTNRLAQRWADMFTSKFDALCEHNAAFGDLRNAIDLNIVATIISGHRLAEVAGCDLAMLYGEAGALPTPTYSTPKTIAPEFSFIKGRLGWTISASGGVELNPWRVVSEQVKVDQGVKAVHAKAASGGHSWWW